MRALPKDEPFPIGALFCRKTKGTGTSPGSSPCAFERMLYANDRQDLFLLRRRRRGGRSEAGYTFQGCEIAMWFGEIRVSN